jgi:hypothetical protein
MQALCAFAHAVEVFIRENQRVRRWIVHSEGKEKKCLNEKMSFVPPNDIANINEMSHHLRVFDGLIELSIIHPYLNLLLI